MRLDQESTNAFNTHIKSARFSQSTKIISANVDLLLAGPIVNIFDPGSGTYNVRLPPLQTGRFYTIMHTGVAGVLNVVDFAGAAVTSLTPGVSTLLFGGDDKWSGVSGASTGVFGPVGPTHSTGLVPDPGPGAAGSPHRYLSETGVFETVVGLVASNAYFYTQKGGTVTLTPVGSETLEFLSANTAISILAQSGTTPKSMLFTLNAANIDHNALTNYNSDRHYDHTAITMTAGLGIAGGGTIAASRTFDFDPSELTIAAPTLTDHVVFAAAGGPRRGLLTTLNGVIDHNALLNYVADQHVAHSGVSIVAGPGLSGGGNITSSRSLSLDVNGLVSDTPAPGDFVAFYDISGGDHNKVAVSGLNAVLDHNALGNYVANQHFPDAPSDGTQYARQSATWTPVAAVGGGGVSISDTPPVSPSNGNLWWESDTGNLYIWYMDGTSNQWVAAGPRIV